ncbi:MAG: thioredoxin [Bacillota bacterium]|nr:thioredoxin [Bacillota bacterium]
MMNITDATFRTEVLTSTEPVLVDFWAPWCMPCRMLAPIVEKVGKHYDGRVKVVKLNVDENLKTSSQYDIMAIPTMILFKNGKPVERFAGLLSEATLKQNIERFLA